MPGNYDDIYNDYYSQGIPLAPSQPPIPVQSELPAGGIAAPEGFDPVSEYIGPEQTPQSLPPPQSTSSSTANSVSVGQTGLNRDTLDYVTDTGNKQVDSAVNRRMQGVNRDAEANAEDADYVAGKKKGAVGLQEDAEKKIAAQEAQNLADEAELNREMQAFETDAAARAHTKTEAALGQYITSMQEYDAMQVNPGQMWDNLGSGAKFANMVSVFVSGMLGAKGIDTGVMKTLNDGIERNIDAQLANINKKGKTVDQFKQVWDMTREESLTDAEAREKMRGFMMRDFKNAAASKLAAFGTDLATAKAAAISAAADQELATTLERIRANRSGAELAITGQEQNAYEARVRASQESKRIALATRQADREDNAARAAAADAAKKAANSNLIFDTTPGSGKVWKFRDDTTDKKREELKDSAALNGSILSQLEEAKQLQKLAGKGYYGPGSKITKGEMQARLDQLQSNIIAVITKENSGLTVNADEAARYKEMLQVDTMINREKFDKLASQLTQIRKNDIEYKLGQYTTEVPEEDRGLIDAPSAFSPDVIGENGATEGFGEGYATGAKLSLEGNKEEVTKQEKLRAKVDTIKADSPSAGASPTQLDSYSTYRSTIGKPIAGTNTRDAVPPKEFIYLSELKDLATGGDAEALKTLQDVASKTEQTIGKAIGAGETKTEAANIAKFMLDDLAGIPHEGAPVDKTDVEWFAEPSQDRSVADPMTDYYNELYK